MVEKVSRCNILKLTRRRPKKDNGALLSGELFGIEIVGLPIFGSMIVWLGMIGIGRRSSLVGQQEVFRNQENGATAQGGYMELEEVKADQLADDIIKGAAAIAEYLFGSRELRRKVYHLAETSKLPVFRLGSVLCVRKSVLVGFIAEQEKRVLPLLSDSAMRPDRS